MASLRFERIDSLKRVVSNNDAGVCSKKFKFTVAHDSDSSSGEVESVYSYQDHPTASAHDTTDTDEDEYEVRSLSEVTVNDTSSGPEDSVVLGNLNSILRGNSVLDELYLADLSSCTSEDDETHRSSQKRCEKCKAECEEPFTLCLKCFRQRKTYLPPRPKGKRRKGRNDSGFGCQGSQGSIAGSQGSIVGSQRSIAGSQGSTAGSQGSYSGSQGGDYAFHCHQASQQGSRPEPRLSQCKCCFACPVDGAFIHRDTVHSLFCYKCSVRTWKTRGKCPFCNQKLCKVAKIFPVED